MSFIKLLPVLLSDSYKQFHHPMYPPNMSKLYSNMTPRKSRLELKSAVWFGLQYYLKEYLVGQWNELFFNVPFEDVEKEYRRFHKYFSGREVTVDHIKSLHQLGYMPLEIKALPEGELVPMKVPFYTITNTHPDHGWLVNFLETQMSTVIWDLVTVATVSYEYRQLFSRWLLKTTGKLDGLEWQAHDFSMRGRSSIESSVNQMGHLLSFRGTDTIPAVLGAERYYGANIEKELVGASVPATEHSVMTSYGRESEIEAFERLLKLFPDGILSVVADSYDLFSAIKRSREELYDLIMGRDGKLVYRPDSGDPVLIITGWKVIDLATAHGATDFTGYEACKLDSKYYTGVPISYGLGMRGPQWTLADNARELSEAEVKGVVELLYDLFGGTVNELGYKLLDSHVGCIYGDSITLDRAEQICKRLEAKGFASSNWVAGIGSYTFNYNTRDTLGIAVKSTYCEISDTMIVKEPVEDEDGNIVRIDFLTESGLKGHLDITDEDTEDDIVELLTEHTSVVTPREIFKDPITDDGTKKSAKGLLRVERNDAGEFYLIDQVTVEEEELGELKTVYVDGHITQEWTLAEIREVVDKNINKYLQDVKI